MNMSLDQLVATTTATTNVAVELSFVFWDSMKKSNRFQHVVWLCRDARFDMSMRYTGVYQNFFMKLVGEGRV